MNKHSSHSAAQTMALSPYDIVGLWTTALWILAAGYVLTTFHVY